MSAWCSLGSGALRRLAAPVRARASSRSCAGPTPPSAPPPCAGHKRPPCRPPPPCSASSAVRVVCCAPPRGRRPPCDPRPPRPHLACADARSDEARTCVATESDACCGSGQDRVAHRLAAAAAARRRDYEREVREQACACRPAPEAPPYAPGAARDCLRATDGQTYALKCAPRRTARCGPGRQPPPPELVHLAREHPCRLNAAPDPCAHHPRTIVEVDRGPPTEPPATPAPAAPLPPPAAPCGCGPDQPRGLAERIVAGLRGQSQPPRRQLHTAASLGAPAAGGGLRVAGRGRETVPCAAAVQAVPSPPAGRLELAVPAGATRLCVLVSIASGSAPRGGVPCGVTRRESMPAGGGGGGGGACAARSPAAVGGDSWLSIRSLQRKLSGCGRDSSGTPGCPPQPQVTPSCPPPAPQPPAEAPAPSPRSPCSPPPPKSSPCSPRPPKSSQCERGSISKKNKKFSQTPSLIA